MSQSEWISWKICAHRRESHQDSEGGTQEPQAGVERASKKLPRHTTQYNESCSSNSTVWKTELTTHCYDNTPELTTHCYDAEIQERDRTGKVNMKKHAYNKHYIKPSTVKEGDTVFFRRDDSKKKSDTPYDTRPLIVVEKKGSMVNAQDDSIPVKKNSSYFKSVPAAAEEIPNNPADVTSAPDTADVPMQSNAALSRRYTNTSSKLLDY